MNESIVPTRPLCILHSDDAPLRHRLAGILNERAYICHAPDQHRLEELLGGGEPLLLFVDLRVEEALDLLPRLSRLHPHAVVVALGYPGSDPFRAAQDIGVYRVEDLEADRKILRELADLIVERVGWMQETQMLRDELARLRTIHHHGAGGRNAAPRNVLSLQHLIKATQHLDPLEDLFAKIVDGVASAALVSRVGLFYRSDGENLFRLHAGRCCLDDTQGLEFSDRDPLVRWLQRHPRLITRASLDHIADPAERTLLRRSLDMLGAETFIPLNLRGRVLGWLFTGQTDGLPFDHSDHPELSFLSEHIVHALENTIKHQEALSQKTLGENLLQMMVTAVITTDAEGNVTWCNAPAERLFPTLARGLTQASKGPAARTSAPRPVEDLGSRLGSLVRDALAGEPTQEPYLLESRAAGGRTLAVRTRQLTGGGKCLGAVALVDDITEKLFADAQQEQIERTHFWRELASGISHEIRNPLVAIKTFTQLLPARHTDESFRLEFREMVTREVNRLDGIVAQIEGFAHPAAGVIDRTQLPALLQEAADGARAATEALDAQIKFQVDENLPPWLGDAKALTQAFQHLFVNSIEAAMRNKVRAQVRVRVVANKAGSEVVGYKLAFVDNGLGIADDILPHAFSPFCSSKAQGLGLGLPIAQRVVLDHGGRIELDSGSTGLGVNILLPLEPPPALANTVRLPAGQAPAGALPESIKETQEQALPYEFRARLKG